MTAEPYRPASSRAGALENLDAARESFETIAGAVQGRSRLTAAQIAEAGVGVLMVLVPVARGLVWAVLDVADAVREAATPPPPDVLADPWPARMAEWGVGPVADPADPATDEQDDLP